MLAGSGARWGSAAHRQGCKGRAVHLHRGARHERPSQGCRGGRPQQSAGVVRAQEKISPLALLPLPPVSALSLSLYPSLSLSLSLSLYMYIDVFPSLFPFSYLLSLRCSSPSSLTLHHTGADAQAHGQIRRGQTRKSPHRHRTEKTQTDTCSRTDAYRRIHPQRHNIHAHHAGMYTPARRARKH